MSYVYIFYLNENMTEDYLSLDNVSLFLRSFIYCSFTLI